MAKKAKKKGKRGPAKGEGGRPPIELDETTFKELCKIQCTLVEIAAILKVSEPTLITWVKRTYNDTFLSVFKKFSSEGKMSLRRTMFRTAIGTPTRVDRDDKGKSVIIEGIKPNPTIQIWLSKQHLGMTDKNEIEVNVKPYVIEAPNGKEVMTLGSQNVIEGEIINPKDIEDAEQRHYDDEELTEEEGDKDESTEVQPIRPSVGVD